MNKDKIILGIHYGHDATAVLIKDGKILEAMSEERLSKQKKHWGFPHLSLDYIKSKHNIDNFGKVVVVGEFLEYGAAIFNTKENIIKENKNPKKVNYYIRSLGFRFKFLGKLVALRDAILEKKVNSKRVKLEVENYIKNIFPESEIEYIHHHDAHAYAAIPFMRDHKKSIVLTCDGAGDDACGSVSIYENGKMSLKSRFKVMNSLGLLYCAFVDLLGMKRNEHEFKVMGLAPYAKASSGEKVYNELREVIWYDKENMTLDAKFDMTKATAYLIAREFNLRHRFDSLAYGVQKLTESILVEMTSHVIEKFNCGNIAVGGGVFMNVKANQKILALDEVQDFTVSPSCGDESLAIGAAVYGYIKHYDYQDIKKVENIYWGSEYSDQEIKKAIDEYQFSKENQNKISVEYINPTLENNIEKRVASLLAQNNVVGRLSDRSEWGARALGNRSILANPSSMDNVKLINEMIKNRDFWMPFATSILAEDSHLYLNNEKMKLAPYMAITFETKEVAQKNIIAALHPYDMTSRPQTVTKEANKKYHNIISEFKSLTGISGILNTSFNLHGEPNVESPYDAIRTFDLSGMKYVAIGNYLLSKK